MLTKLTPELMVEDVNKTVQFYCDTLGFTLINSVPEEEDSEQYQWASVQSGNFVIMLQSRKSLVPDMPEFEKIALGGSFFLFIETANVMLWYETIKEKVQIVQDLHTTNYGTQEFMFKDINGYILVFAQRKELPEESI